MSDSHDFPPAGSPPPPPGDPLPPRVLPVRYPPPPPPAPARRPLPPPRPRSGGLLTVFLVLALAFSVGFNLLLLFFGALSLGGDGGSGTGLYERYHSGDARARDKIAIVRIDGVLMEGLTLYAQKQIDEAATDPNVKAVVLRIDSPGGSITASDDLHKRITELKNGARPGQRFKKPVVISMGSMAASGGYYIAMPGDIILAERTTVTGSIGVYAAFPNIADLAEKHGFKMITIKAGDVKDSGSMFKDMSPQERQLWQDMVNNAYGQFIAVVEEGRPELQGKMTDVVLEKKIPKLNEKGQPAENENGDAEMVNFVRRRADGGIFTAQDAKKFGLIDDIGYLTDAIAEAKKRTSDPNAKYRIIHYERPVTLLGALMGAQAKSSPAVLDANRLAQGASPRLWYLAPQSEMAGILAAVGKE